MKGSAGVGVESVDASFQFLLWHRLCYLIDLDYYSAF